MSSIVVIFFPRPLPSVLFSKVRKKGGFQKGGFGGCSPVRKTETRVHSDVPRYQKQGRALYGPMPVKTETFREL